MTAAVFLRLLCICLPLILFSIFGYLLLYKTKKVSKLNKWVKSLIIGIIFGVLGIGSFYFGVQIDGVNNGYFGNSTLVTILTALIFDIPSSGIATLIMFVYRIFITPFTSSDVLKVPALVSFILVFSVVALAKKFVFKNKCPNCFVGLFLSIIVIDLQMLVLFLFFINKLTLCYQIISKIDLACIIVCGIITFVSLLFIHLINKEPIFSIFKDKHIANKLQKNIFVGFVISFTLSSSLIAIINYTSANKQIRDTLNVNLDGLENDLSDPLNSLNINTLATHRYVGYYGFSYIGYTGKANTAFYIKDGVPTYFEPNTIVSISKNKAYYLNTKFVDPDFPENENVIIELYNVRCFYTFRRVDLKVKIGEETETWNFTIGVGHNVDEALTNIGTTFRLMIHCEVIVYVIIYLLVLFFVKRRIINNVDRINASLKKITYGDLNEEIKVDNMEEFISLADDMNLTVGALKNYAEEVERRIEKDLELAKDIQSSALPNIFPDNKNLSLYAKMQPAKEIGGDFYDFVKYSENEIFFMIADVSGKGIPAALFMMRAKSLIKSLGSSSISLESLVKRTNDELCSGNERGLFVTAWFGFLDLTSGILTYVNAGHNPPILFKDGKYKEYMTPANLVLAGYEGVPYKQRTIQLSKGDKIVLYTDGVTEALDKDLKLYGTKRLVELLNNNSKLVSSKAIVNCIFDDVNEYQKEVTQADDITVLVVSYNVDSKVKNKK